VRPVNLDRELFNHLAAITGEALISIYLPTEVRGDAIDQNRIRMKNGIAQAESLLETAGWKKRERNERLEVALGLLKDHEFWRHQKPALAVFIDESETTAVALASGAEERTVVADVFHLRPLIPSLEPVELMVLALTMDGVGLYRASLYDIHRVEADLPGSLDDVNWFVDREKQRQQHADQAGSKRSRHGHEPAASRHEDLARFLRAVDGAIPAAKTHGPLVVLGDDNLVARFAQVSERDIVSAANGRVADADEIDTIHNHAAELVRDHIASLRQEYVQLGLEQMGTGDAITDISDGLGAAVSGRISEILLSEDAAPLWGRFDTSTLEVVIDEDQEAGDVDLLDRLAVLAMGTGAHVTTVGTAIEGHDFVAIPRF
jgi:hypothetical protein